MGSMITGNALKNIGTQNMAGINTRLIPGIEGKVTGGNSTKLGKNIMESMDLKRSTKWTGYQAQHIILADMANDPVIQRLVCI